jgi:selenocysteine-specific elongation factor
LLSFDVRSLILGTAGHIDHGKSALVRALTGTDPDRLKEEKERGITIDLGFAHLDLGGGRVASFIDVPGHERFVRNMLAGAHGIDAVMLVVAADESVMPQTREHFHICRLLGIERGLLALTKCDAADEDLQRIAEEDVRALVAGSFLEGAPLLRLSARTGLGLPELKAELARLAERAPPRAAGGLLRLPVDRSFTMRGFGTVITGTLVSGVLALGDEVELLPAGRRGRVRGLQVHGQAVERVEAGNRAAVNLAGMETSEVERGHVLVRPGSLRPSSMVDVELTLLPSARPLADQARVRVHAASAEVLARVRLPGRRLEPGATAVAQLRLEAPAVTGRGDRLILRTYSPADTIGGALVLDPLAPKRRGQAAAPPARSQSPAAAAAALVEGAGAPGIAAPMLAARLTLPLEDLDAALAAEPRVLRVGRGAGTFVSRELLQRLRARALEELAAFHAADPMRPGMPREELRARAFARAAEGAFEHVMGELSSADEVRVEGERVARAGHAPTLTDRQSVGRDALLKEALGRGLEGLEPGRAAAVAGVDAREADRLLRLLLAEGQLRRVGEAVVHRAPLDALKDDVRRRWAPGSRLDVGAFKDLTGLSRKFVIPLLEYLDRERVTRRAGAERTVVG